MMQSGAIEFKNPRGKDHFSDPGLIGGLRGQNLNGAISFFFWCSDEHLSYGISPEFCICLDTRRKCFYALAA